MRLLEYLNIVSTDEDTKIFRSLSIRLVTEEMSYKDTVNRIQENYCLSKNPIDLLSIINKEFKNVYKGKYKFDLCMNEGKTLNEININKKYQDRFKIKWYEFNNELTLIKKEFEKKLKEIMDKN